MSSGGWFDAKEQIRQAVDIVDLVRDYLPLEMRGRDYLARCPWHDDQRPSLHVSPDRQRYHCFVCVKGGDIFSFIMEMEGVEFREALQLLADRAGVNLAQFARPSAHPGEPAASSQTLMERKSLLYRAMEWAEAQYHRCLQSDPQAEVARRYLDERGITPQSRERFQLGFAPQRGGWLQERARNTPFTSDVLEAVGLIAPRKSGQGFYDRFHSRVLFAIHNRQGRPVGLGGRVLPELGSTSPAKYINSPETPLFAKSDLLYGLDVAKDAIRRTKTAIVMEGYTDCIMAHQYGIENAVAVLGTALGPRHVRLLRGWADRIVLVLDGDEAGRGRASEILELFVAQQADLRILTLPSQLDPCDFLRREGADAFAQLLDTAVDALEHKFRLATANVGFASSAMEAGRALEEVLQTLAKAPRLKSDTPSEVRLKEHLILQRLGRKFSVDEAMLRTRLTDLRRLQQRGVDTAPREVERGLVLNPKERELLQLVLAFPEGVPQVFETIDVEQIQSPAARHLLEKCRHLIDEGLTPNYDRLMLELEDPRLKSLLVELDEQALTGDNPILALRLRQLLERIRDQQERRAHQAHSAALQQQEHGADEELRLLSQIVQQRRMRQGISKPMEG